MTLGTQTGALWQPRGVGWGRRWEGDSTRREHVHLRLIHVDVWQKPTQYCKAIILQLKVNKLRRNFCLSDSHHCFHSICPHLPMQFPPESLSWFCSERASYFCVSVWSDSVPGSWPATPMSRYFSLSLREPCSQTPLHRCLLLQALLVIAFAVRGHLFPAIQPCAPWILKHLIRVLGGSRSPRPGRWLPSFCIS